MTITGLLGRLLGLESAQQIEGIEPSLAAPWAHDSPGWVFFGCLALSALAVLFYARYQRRRNPGGRVVLAVLRAIALSLLLVMLAEPVLTLTVRSQKRPSLWLLVDGTDSMNLADEMSQPDRQRLLEAVGYRGAADEQGGQSPGNPLASTAVAETTSTRAELVKALLKKDDGQLLERLSERFRLRVFLFDRPDGVRALEMTSGRRRRFDPDRLAEQLTAEGSVTALGAAFDDLARRYAASQLAGLVVLSDFGQNTGPPAQAAARALGVPIYAVGVGATGAADLAVTAQAPLHVKKEEQAPVTVTLRQQGLDGQTVAVKLSLAEAGQPSEAAGLEPIDEKTVTLDGPEANVEFSFVPDKAGRFTLVAEVEPVAGEVVEENNVARRDVTVLDDFLRLLFVEYEPTWEWRFIKEVFHRDKLVGMEGFRTFLRSSDPRVRQTSPMFLTTMTPPRSEFFEYDVIFLGDMPASALSPRFCEMTAEFVKDFGGGLVILAGPRFGPGQLADTPLADLLPVKPSRGSRLSDRQPFRLQLTPRALGYDFMRLGGENEAENRRAWDNLGPIPWYQPVERVYEGKATVLAEHPSQTCADGKTHQPLVAICRAGRGEVVYVGFDETWRLRRKYGEKYYRQFWGQMIHRLGLSHELGSQKRFVVRTDRRRYQANDEVILTVEAYDADFQKLGEDKLPERKLRGQLFLPSGVAAAPPETAASVQALSIPMLSEGVFETRFPVFAGGEYKLSVTDPITGRPVDAAFQVSAATVERQTATRNVTLQDQIARVHPGGRSYDLLTVARLPDEIDLSPKTEVNVEVVTLWNTWLFFGAVVGLLFAEWLLRKWVNLV